MFNVPDVISRAWAIFCADYGYSGKEGIPFTTVGRHCFGASLRKAWHEYRDAKALAAIPVAVKAQRITTLKNQLEDLVWMENWRQAQVTRASIEAEISRLACVSEFARN